MLRIPFSFGGMERPYRGVRITRECIGCGECMQRCSFKAIYQEGEAYRINHEKCDVCGDCAIVCPADAIEVISEG